MCRLKCACGWTFLSIGQYSGEFFHMYVNVQQTFVMALISDLRMMTKY